MLVDPDRDVSATSSAQDTMVVEITCDEGLSGVGETDLNPDIAQACIEAPGAHSMALGLREMLIGEDALDVGRLWNKLYVGSAMSGRRGAGINAIGALDIALHDLRGKILDQPCWEGLRDGHAAGKKPRTTVRPYASLQPNVDDIDAYEEALIEDALAAHRKGFKAIKASLTFAGPYAHRGMRTSWERTTEMLIALRRALGSACVLMVDVQYAFTDVHECIRVLETWTDCDLFFVETPLWADNIDGYRRLTEAQEIPIAMGEWLTTHHEFDQFLRVGALDVVQPDIGRVGGLTEACKVARLAGDCGAMVVPHLWKSGISIAAALHFAAVTPGCPFIEFLPVETSGSAIRRELLTADFQLSDGVLALPEGPGLGIELDRDALRRFAASTRR